MVDKVLSELAVSGGPFVLIIDDLHELSSGTVENAWARVKAHLDPAPGDAAPRGGLRGAASGFRRGLCYGVTELTDVPQLARPSLVPPQVPIALGWKAGGAQFGCWMYSLAK